MNLHQFLLSLQALGCCRWFLVPLCSHARKAVEEFKSGWSVARTPQSAKGFGHYVALYAGRYKAFNICSFNIRNQNLLSSPKKGLWFPKSTFPSCSFVMNGVNRDKQFCVPHLNFYKMDWRGELKWIFLMAL